MATATGAFAELAVVDATQAMRVPEGLAWVEAAAAGRAHHRARRAGHPGRVHRGGHGAGAGRHVGGATLAGALAATRVGGTIVSVGRLSGPEGTLDLDVLAYRRLSLVGTTVTVRGDDERARVVAALAPEVLPAVAAGRIRPVVDRVVAFDAANEALEHMRTGRAAGKIVLECSPP